MNNVEIEYNRLISVMNVASTELYNFCNGKQNAIGLMPDELWLHDAKCLELKKNFRVADYNFKQFIKLNKEEVKIIQKQQHEERRNRFKIN